MKIQFRYCGPWSLKPLESLASEYQKRISHYFPCELVAFKKKKPGEFWVLLDLRGKTFDSKAFAKWIEEKSIRSVKNICFCVGPAEGFSPADLTQADFVLSLSPMTLQHELALVVLLEQIYRACTILRGEPYHK